MKPLFCAWLQPIFPAPLQTQRREESRQIKDPRGVVRGVVRNSDLKHVTQNCSFANGENTCYFAEEFPPSTSAMFLIVSLSVMRNRQKREMQRESAHLDVSVTVCWRKTPVEMSLGLDELGATDYICSSAAVAVLCAVQFARL
ncbi:hypothetical protein BaRGS_00021763 [Batillaria attramentaria]|uniref:Uncharacterized protein n=1 Tax=Batillaria attramentaria TaxID=370345 RepID=A0ABD0KIR0_9CAEN